MVVGVQHRGGGTSAAGIQKRSRRRRTYIPNRVLGVRRATNAFALFLQSLAGSMPKYKCTRIRGKTSIWRMDLLRDKFNLLTPGRRSQFEQAAYEAVTRAHDDRLRALRLGHPADRGHRGDGRQPDAGASGPALADANGVTGTCSVWMRVDLPDLQRNGGQQSIIPGTDSDARSITGGGIDFSITWQSQGGVKHECSGVEVLGSGSYGSCLMVRDAHSQQLMIAKVAVAGEEYVKTSLRAELAALCRLSHPNVIRAFGAGVAMPGRRFVVMMPLFAGNLWQWISRQALPANERSAEPAVVDAMSTAVPEVERGFLLQIASGLVYVHAHSIVHCDLKPDNILVDMMIGEVPSVDSKSVQSRPSCRIADFGMCQSLVEVAGIPSEGRVAASHVNSEPYRPFWLFQCKTATVLVRALFDVWAFAGVIFDVAQAPRWRVRDRRNKPLRFMCGFDYDTATVRDLRLERNRRVLKYVFPSVRPIIFEAQPHKPVGCSVSAADVYTKLTKLPTTASRSHPAVAVASQGHRSATP